MKPERDKTKRGATAANSGAAATPATPPGVADLAPADPREYMEPGEMDRPISLTYVLFLCAFFAWGGFYVQRYSAGYDALGYDEYSAGPGAVKTNAVQAIDPYVLGRRLYADTCAKCHQQDGLGVAGQYPPLAGSEWVLSPGPARMIRIVLDTIQGPITVKGVSYNNTMTPWRDTLNDQQIAAVITYVRTQKEWNHNASPVTPEEVADIRKKTKDRPALGPYAASEMLAIPDHEPPPPTGPAR
jgi:mono/diheme cytochrome c family protein